MVSLDGQGSSDFRWQAILDPTAEAGQPSTEVSRLLRLDLPFEPLNRAEQLAGFGLIGMVDQGQMGPMSQFPDRSGDHQAV
jgi:hypothetical protein